MKSNLDQPKRSLMLLVIIFVFPSLGKAQIIPKYWEKTVIMIYKDYPQNDVQPHGTGFLVDDKTSVVGDSAFIITNKHILGGHKKIYLLLNAIPPLQSFVSGVIAEIELCDSSGRQLWTGHPDSCVDVAVQKIRLSTPEGRRAADLWTIATPATKNRKCIREGQNIIYLGFPYGIQGRPGHAPVYRHGIVSLLNTGDCLNQVYIEAQAWPGNSGSPVFAVPVLTAETNIFDIEETKLIGILGGHISFNERVPISDSTYIKLQTHSGLSYMYTTDAIYETIHIADPRQ